MPNKLDPCPFDNLIITNIEHKQDVIKPQTKLHSSTIINDILNQILTKTKQKTYQRKVLKSKLNQYCVNFANVYSGQSVSMQAKCKIHSENFKDEQQPNPLISDNLIPVGTILEQRSIEPLKNNSLGPQDTSTILKSQFSTNKLSRKISLAPQQNMSKNNPKTYQYIKLKQENLPKIQVSFEPFIKELRRQKQLNYLEKQKQKKQKKKTNTRQIIKKDERISYDFQGQIIKIKQSNKKMNFISNSVNGCQNQQLTKKQKQAKVDTDPFNLDNIQKKNTAKQNFAKKVPDIEFSNIGSLTPQLLVNEGVRFTHNKVIMQKEKKQYSIVELSKSLSSRKLSKRDLQRLKSIESNRSVHSKAQSPFVPTVLNSYTDVKDKNYSALGRSVSENKTQPKSTRSRKPGNIMLQRKLQQRISVQNQELTSLLLENTLVDIQVSIRQRLSSDHVQKLHKKQLLSKMDRANLQYIKTGSVGKTQFPKITYRTAANHQIANKNYHINSLLQSKTKIKGKHKQNEFQRLKKHFEDKLRV